MAQNIKLQANISGDITVGANPQPPNELILTIENKGDAIASKARTPPYLYLKGKLGQGEGALFATKEDARDNCTVGKPEGWQRDWDFPADDAFSLRLCTDNDTILGQNDKITVTLSNVVSATAPGRATLSFETDLSQDAQTLSVAKAANTAGIIYFASDPEQGVRNLPFDSVTLRWRTFRLEKRELSQFGAGIVRCDFGKDEGAVTITCGSADATYKLKGYPTDGSQPLDRDLVVRVLQSGWYGQKNTLYEGDLGYPDPADKASRDELECAKRRFDLEPTVLFNANDQSLYGIFRYWFQEQERAMLFQAVNPFGVWKFIPASVPDQQGAIPERFSTSPGLYFDDSLWLIGGSRIDPDINDNTVWRFDRKALAWKNLGPATWTRRMGHAVLAYQNKIWLMGGRDDAGNALNEVWRLDDVAANKWTQLDKAPWTPRCLFGPAVFQDQIWVYGGVPEPFSSNLYDDAYAYANGKWSKKELTGIISGSTARKPIASCLQEFDKRLCLFGKFRSTAADRSESVDSLAFSLSTPATKTWDGFPSDGLKGWGDDTTFSYQLLNYKKRMLIASVLSYQTPNTVMKIYVPG
jgi:Kelch motif